MRRKKSNIVSYTDKELERAASRTDWARVKTTTQKDVEAQIAADPDDWVADAGGVLLRGLPPRPQKERVNIRLDRDVLDFFRAQGRGYQTRINAVLRVFAATARVTDGRKVRGRPATPKAGKVARRSP
jgi:uncharacterized protein (DUF4415 family)